MRVFSNLLSVQLHDASLAFRNLAFDLFYPSSVLLPALATVVLVCGYSGMVGFFRQLYQIKYKIFSQHGNVNKTLT